MSKRDVEIKIGKDNYTLHFDMAAVCQIENITGKPIFHFLQSDDDGNLPNISMSFLVTAMTAGLAKYHRPLAKTSRVKVMIDPFPEQMDSYARAVLKGILLWQGADPDKLEAALAAPAEGDGGKKALEAGKLEVVEANKPEAAEAASTSTPG